MNVQRAVQVIEIVRKNVRVLLESQRYVNRGRPTLQLDSSFTPQSVDDQKLYKMFQRVFSRMLWNGGRGLSDCLGLDQWYVQQLYVMVTKNVGPVPTYYAAVRLERRNRTSNPDL